MSITVEIKISAPAHAGKSTIAHLIHRTLREAGFALVRNDDDAAQHIGTRTLKMQAQAIESLAGIPITIVTEQRPREPKA